MTQYGGPTGKWYLGGTTKKNFDDAVNFCAGLGLTLATVGTAADFAHVKAFMSE